MLKLDASTRYAPYLIVQKILSPEMIGYDETHQAVVRFRQAVVRLSSGCRQAVVRHRPSSGRRQAGRRQAGRCQAGRCQAGRRQVVVRPSSGSRPAIVRQS